jgi:branched-chain amino acid transport system permease protein
MNKRFDPTMIGLAAALPVLLAVGLVLPSWLTFYLQVSLASGLAALGVMLQMRAGLVNFGQGLYYCLGAYAAGMSGHFLGLTDAVVLVLMGIVLAVTVSFVVGFLVARYREIFYAMLSLALSMILYGLLVRAEALGSTDGFNLPATTFLGYAPEGAALRQAGYVFTCILALAIAAGVHRYLRSPLGAIGEAIRENELRVEYLGASPRAVVHLIYVMAAAISGVGGVLVGISIGHVDPNLAYWTTSGQFVFIALLSGTGNVAAPLIGAFLLVMGRVYATEYSPYTWQMILGIVMLLVIVFLPGGLWSLTGMRGRRS